MDTHSSAGPAGGARHGQGTGEFGEWLGNHLRASRDYSTYAYFYDHGDRRNDPHVRAVKAFVGERVANDNRIADVDVIVVRPDGTVALLIEIEERSCVPKKVLGDAMAILICNGFAVGSGAGQQYFTVDHETRLLIVGTMASPRRAELMIEPRVRAFVGPSDAITPANVDFILRASMPEAMDALQLTIAQLFPQ